jgi:Ca-activated chloride channel family protein
MADFHFLRPYWLFAFFVLFGALYLLKKIQISRSGWHNIIPKHLATILIANDNQHSQSTKQPLTSRFALLKPFIIGSLTIIALAGPTWKKLPQPVYKVAKGAVIIMDMSYSMYATDLLPNRLTRARYKAIDLLNGLKEGDIGLIAYAGDAFIISPLTEDGNNIKLLLPSLSPDIMPEPGSNPLAALIMADKMLRNAGHPQGDVYWFTDGVDQEDIHDINQWSKNHPHQLNILGVGTTAGAPIKLPNGELLKDSSGAIVIPRLSAGILRTLAQNGRGVYQTIRHDNKDIEALIAKRIIGDENKKQQKQSSQLGDQWQEAGPYLVLLILPLLLSYFRRGVLFICLPCSLLLLSTPKAQANIWQDLWETKEQQAQKAFNQQKYQQAAKNFSDPLWQGSAYYKAGEYEKALEAFEKKDTAQALYNKGNALAKLNKYEEALQAYQQALAKDPKLADAKANKKMIEELLKKQQQNKEQQNKDQQAQNEQQNKDQQTQNEQQNKDQQAQNEQQVKAQAKLSEKEKEMQQKHQQLLNKVTDDPYLLLRNKMQLEYQKRRHNNRGVKKIW